MINVLPPARSINEFGTDALASKEASAGICECCHTLQAVDVDHLCLYCSVHDCGGSYDVGNPHSVDNVWTCACKKNCGSGYQGFKVFMKCMKNHKKTISSPEG